ncbi:hypothetical protein LZ32DRAFT_148049 [Colletotrichum eremochloae]|nr:hypothetical protein LZ32DRAFT_148049 [Colletotrichum eremochloae]
MTRQGPVSRLIKQRLLPKKTLRAARALSENQTRYRPACAIIISWSCGTQVPCVYACSRGYGACKRRSLVRTQLWVSERMEKS